MKPKVGFICVHNSCRSQMAEALSKMIASNVYDAYSAGTHVKPSINSDAVRLIKERFNVDMLNTHHSKLIDSLPPLDIVITMGCNVSCPYLECKHREDWDLEDPSGQGDEMFNQTIDTIVEKIHDLVLRIESNVIEL